MIEKIFFYNCSSAHFQVLFLPRLRHTILLELANAPNVV